MKSLRQVGPRRLAQGYRERAVVCLRVARDLIAEHRELRGDHRHFGSLLSHYQEVRLRRERHASVRDWAVPESNWSVSASIDADALTTASWVTLTQVAFPISLGYSEKQVARQLGWTHKAVGA